MNDYRQLEDALNSDNFQNFKKIATSGVNINAMLDSVGNILHLYIDTAEDLSDKYEAQK